jgi:hypothetical protein
LTWDFKPEVFALVIGFAKIYHNKTKFILLTCIGPLCKSVANLLTAYRSSIQPMKHRCNSSGLSLANTRLNVSADGIPFGNSKNVPNHSCLLRPYSAIASQLSPPQIMPQIVMMIMSNSLCSTLCVALGSFIFQKCVSIRPMGLGIVNLSPLILPYPNLFLFVKFYVRLP